MRKYSKEVDFLFIYFTFSEVKFSKKRHLHVKGGGGGGGGGGGVQACNFGNFEFEM